MTGTHWQGILNSVRQANDLYGLIPAAEPVAVAFSGGKDSLILALVLRELGVPVICVSIDMGYESGWGGRIMEMASRAGLPVDVVDVRAGPAVAVRDRTTIRRSLSVLDVIQAGATPCTHCYNVKVLALESRVRAHGASVVAFGHHRTDALASLLKEALMHIDRWDEGNSVFVRDNFAALVERFRVETVAGGAGGRLLDRITELVHTDLVDTDEPPRQPLNRDNPGVQIIRPMFFVDEKSIIEIIAERDIKTEGSGCSHGLAANYLTPREMVHYGVLRHASGRWLNGHLEQLLMHGIDEYGRARLAARRHRAALLGARYKPGLNKP
ncbi:hypothetical protein GCM10009555_050170 [Acrocarpospora macrocephala]|uniref:Uncharacterized protein n=1 Tax=Acrocarpospora macrocephala TaxID=150177 RepID=A0A5M3WX88_9ACTN|nr:phosphoadenosine phosphosulfate reductase family protein [Acrocarpospora macrocephala]GES12862.1 hypothetical protein Amac_064590 [Acrocarpospora macrocephala]